MTRRDIMFLKSQQEYPSVSITISCDIAMPGRQQNSIRLKNGIKLAKEQLLKEFDEREITSLINRLEQAAAQVNFKDTQARGMVLFANKNFSALYELPVAVADNVNIAGFFNVSDILDALNRVPKYWVLALSEKPARFFYGVGNTLTEIIEPAQDTLGQDQDGFPYTYVAPELQESFSIDSGTNMHISYGSTDMEERKKKFVEYVFDLAQRFLKVEPLPLVVVAEEDNYFMFKKASHDYPALFAKGDMSKRSAHDIAQVVWPVIEKYLEEECVKKIKHFEQDVMGTKKHAFGMHTVWRDAQEGRVHELLVEEGFAMYGVLDPSNPAHFFVSEASAPGAVDLVSKLVEVVLNMGDGKVVFCKKGSLEKYEHVAAILRY